MGTGVEHHLGVVAVGRDQRPHVGGGVDGDVQQRRSGGGEQLAQRVFHRRRLVQVEALDAERRGFRPVSVDGETQSDGDRWHLRLAVEGDRSADSLQSQLEKLYDCLAVEVSPCR